MHGDVPGGALPRRFGGSVIAGTQHKPFEFFGGVPRRTSYDNSRIAVAKFTGKRGDVRSCASPASSIALMIADDLT
jgi:hypothetical protein